MVLLSGAAKSYHKLGDLIAAQDCYAAAVRGYKESGSADHSQRLDAMFELGIVYAQQQSSQMHRPFGKRQRKMLEARCL